MTAQDFTDILYFYEAFKPQYIQYVDSVRIMPNNQQVIDKFNSIDNNYKDDVFNRIFENRMSEIEKKGKEVIDNYCNSGCKAHCKNCCVFRLINESLLKDIEKVDNFKKSYQTLLNTLNQTIKNILEVHKKADFRTQEHLKMCLDILHLYRYEMQCLLQVLKTYRKLPKNNFVLSHITFPKTPDMVSIPLKESPEYGSPDEFWEEICAIQQKRFEEEYPQTVEDTTDSNKEGLTTLQISFDFSEQWKKYPEEMKKWAETPKTVPELIRKCALEFQDKKPLLGEQILQQNEQKIPKVFISYSRKDVDFKDELKKHLNILSQFNITDNWSCEDIKIGNWNDQIQKELDESNVIIYMLSANFFSSSYILEKEVQSVMDGKRDKKSILCVIVSDFVDLDKIESHLQNWKISDKQSAILMLKDFQYLPYGKEFNQVTRQNEEKIIPLKQFSNNSNIETALKQIVEKVLNIL